MASEDPPEGGPPGQGGGETESETVQALNAVLVRYAGAVSFAVAVLEPALELCRTIAQESEAHPEQPRGEGAAGRARELAQSLEVVYERLRRMASPTAISG